MSHNREKMKSTETNPEIIQIIEFIDKDIKIVMTLIFISHMLRKPKGRLSKVMETIC